ncbi:MAG: hypothetical protein H8D34_00490, partial [Chloroflexi bacterium]|nr:hypothetical protein [Chloroflexota bacterium]
MPKSFGMIYFLEVPKVYSPYVSEYAFNGIVEIQISTDGKFFMVGKMNFAANMISIGVRMYADLSQVFQGSVKVLFLASIPEQFNFLVISGKFSMGFKDADGKPVEFAVGVDSETPYGNMSSPGKNSSISLNTVNDQKYLDVEYMPSTGAQLDEDTIDGDEFTLSGPGLGDVTLSSDAPTKVEGESNVWRYTFTGAFIPGVVDINFASGSWKDDQDVSNIGTTQSFTLTVPSATLAGPTDGASISVDDINNETNTTITVTYTAPGGTSIDDDSIDGDEIELSGPGADGLTVGSPDLVTGTRSTYVYTVSGGDFDPGVVTVTFVEGSFTDTAGTSSVETEQSFIVYSTTVTLAGPLEDTQLDVATLNERGYVDVNFVPTEGATMDAASITDADAEFTLAGSAINDVIFDGSPTLVSDNIYRYTFTGSFVPGDVELNFLVDSWQDSDGNPSIDESHTFVAAGPTVALQDGLEQSTVGLSLINGRHYIAVQYKPTSGSAIDAATINGDEFTLSGPGAQNVSVGAPVLVDAANNIYAYAITGDFEEGGITLSFIAGSFADTAGYGNLASESTTTLASPSADLYAPIHADSIFYDDLNQRGYIFVTFDDPTGSGIDLETLDGDEIAISGDGAVDVFLNTGAPTPLENLRDVLGLDDDAYIPANAFGYAFTGDFTKGGVYIRFREGSFGTNSGATNVEETEGFNVVGQATTYEIVIQGAIAQYIPFINEELWAIEGGVTITIMGTASEARLSIEAYGEIRVIYLGTIASAAAKLVLSIPTTDKDGDGEIDDPELWGVINLEANFTKLIQIGIDLDVYAELKLNFSSETKTERLALPVMQGDYSDELADSLNSLAFPESLKAEMLEQRLDLVGDVE